MIREQGWRAAWNGVGIGLLLLAAISAVLVRHRPTVVAADHNLVDTDAVDGLPLAAALRTPAFWTFGVATSLFGLISSGLSLFNQAILPSAGSTRRPITTRSCCRRSSAWRSTVGRLVSAQAFL